MSARVLLFALTALLATPAAADPLTLGQALARAEEVSAEVQLQALSSESAEARWLADPRAGAPSIRVGVRDLDVPTELEPDPGNPEVVTRLRFPFPRPWDLATAADQGRATVAREDAELEGIRERVRLDVTTRFHAIPLLRDSVEAAGRLTEIRAAHLVLVEQRRAEGLATALDWLDSEEERRDADERQAARLADLEAAEAELRLLLQLPAGEPLDLVPDDLTAATAPEVPTVESLSEGLTARNPDMREAESEIARAEARLRRAKLGALPWLDWAQGGAVFKKDQPTSFEIGFALDVPIYLWSPTRTRAASQEVAAAHLELKEVEQRAERRLARRVRATEAARQRWQVETEHRAAITAQADPLMELADPLLQLELQARLTRAELRVLSALIDLVDQVDRRDAAAHQ